MGLCDDLDLDRQRLVWGHSASVIAAYEQMLADGPNKDCISDARMAQQCSIAAHDSRNYQEDIRRGDPRNHSPEVDAEGSLLRDCWSQSRPGQKGTWLELPHLNAPMQSPSWNQAPDTLWGGPNSMPMKELIFDKPSLAAALAAAPPVLWQRSQQASCPEDPSPLVASRPVRIAPPTPAPPVSQAEPRQPPAGAPRRPRSFGPAAWRQEVASSSPRKTGKVAAAGPRGRRCW